MVGDTICTILNLNLKSLNEASSSSNASGISYSPGSRKKSLNESSSSSNASGILYSHRSRKIHFPRISSAVTARSPTPVPSTNMPSGRSELHISQSDCLQGLTSARDAFSTRTVNEIKRTTWNVGQHGCQSPRIMSDRHGCQSPRIMSDRHGCQSPRIMSDQHGCQSPRIMSDRQKRVNCVQTTKPIFISPLEEDRFCRIVSWVKECNEALNEGWEVNCLSTVKDS